MCVCMYVCEYIYIYIYIYIYTHSHAADPLGHHRCDAVRHILLLDDGGV